MELLILVPVMMFVFPLVLSVWAIYALLIGEVNLESRFFFALIKRYTIVGKKAKRFASIILIGSLISLSSFLIYPLFNIASAYLVLAIYFSGFIFHLLAFVIVDWRNSESE